MLESHSAVHVVPEQKGCSSSRFNDCFSTIYIYKNIKSNVIHCINFMNVNIITKSITFGVGQISTLLYEINTTLANKDSCYSNRAVALMTSCSE